MGLAICAIFRNEAPYLAEWVEFHQLVGIDRFYLYENNSDDDWEPVLRPYQDAGIVRVEPWPVRQSAQLPAYRHFIANHRATADWVAFLDCDEFLFSPCRNSVAELLQEAPLCDTGAVGVHWMCFGASGQQARVPGLVTERFRWRPYDDFGPNQHIKSIVRTNRVERVGGDAHLFHVRGGTRNEAGEQILSPLVCPPRHAVLRINHYVTKSREEWLTRIAHWRVDVPSRRNPSEFDLYQSRDVHDTSIWRFLPELRERLAARGFLG